MPKKINTTKYLEYILDETKKILAIDSPSGFTEKTANYVMNEYAALMMLWKSYLLLTEYLK